ncbi:MAG: hypothetical protein M3P38_10885, partial [Chloroflexota bacterium]|nr:hypothetical protein [Chloroflexota bacterium]
MKLFDSLKRLLEPRARPPAETIGAPTAERPPPLEPEPLPEPASPQVIPVVADTVDVSEVRALLESVAEAPEPAESVAEAPAPAESLAEAPAPALPPEPTPTLLEEVVDVPSAASQQVVGALLLTLTTPPATFTVAK